MIRDCWFELGCLKQDDFRNPLLRSCRRSTNPFNQRFMTLEVQTDGNYLTLTDPVDRADQLLILPDIPVSDRI